MDAADFVGIGGPMMAPTPPGSGVTEAEDETPTVPRPTSRRPRFVRKLGTWTGHHDFVQSIMMLAEGERRTRDVIMLSVECNPSG